MRYAIIADIHANLEALTAVLAFSHSLHADSIICLGDIVGFHANPHECIDLVRDRTSACVRGNHDSVAAGLSEPDDFADSARQAILWTRRALDPDHAAYLASLPLLHHVGDDFVIVHASLHPEPNDRQRIHNPEDARLTLQAMASGKIAQRLCFVGHTHHRIAYALHDGIVSRLPGGTVALEDNTHYLINPGSVGQPRDSDPRASMALFDSSAQTVEFHQISYDRAAALAKAVSAGLIPKRHVLLRSASWLKHRLLPAHP